MEAHWDLGQAYEQMGEVMAAVKEYRTLAGPEGAPPATVSSYADRALHRIEALRNQPALSAGTRSGHTALYVSFNNLPPQSQVETWVRQLSAQGISAILLDASPESSFTKPSVPIGAPSAGALPDSPKGALFATSRGPVLTDWYSVIVPQAHELGISVYAVLDLFHAPLSDDRPASRMLLYDPTRRRVHPWTQFDLLSSAVQPLVAQLLTDLTRSGVDGVVFRARAENSFAYEVSDGVLRQFETQFHQPSSEVAQALRDRMVLRPDVAAPVSDKTLWRWVGWKARQELEVLALLRKHLQKTSASRRAGARNPCGGVVESDVRLGKLWRDAAEARRRGFDLLLGGSSRESSDVRAFAGSFKGWSRDVIQSAKGEPQTLPQGWVLLHTPAEYGSGCLRGSRSRRMNYARRIFVTSVFVPDSQGGDSLTKPPATSM